MPTFKPNDKVTFTDDETRRSIEEGFGPVPAELTVVEVRGVRVRVEPFVGPFFFLHADHLRLLA